MPHHPQTVGRAGRRTRLLAGTCTVVLHLAVVGAAVWFSVRPAPVPQALELVMVNVDQQADQVRPAPAPAPPDVTLARLAPPSVPSLPHLTFSVAPPAPSPSAPVTLTAAQLAGALRAGEGSGSGGCNMAGAVQQALRHDRLVRAAVMDAGLQGQAILLWNGDWVRAGGQAGKGLSAAREAIQWVVAFAPSACRNTRVQGLVLFSLNGEHTRLVIGTASWRWSDLLGLKR